MIIKIPNYFILIYAKKLINHRLFITSFYPIFTLYFLKYIILFTLSFYHLLTLILLPALPSRLKICSLPELISMMLLTRPWILCILLLLSFSLNKDSSAEWWTKYRKIPPWYPKPTLRCLFSHPYRKLPQGPFGRMKKGRQLNPSRY